MPNFDEVDGRFAILVGHKVKLCNLMTWARWLEAASKMPGPQGQPTAKHVAYDDLGAVRISTVFIGMDHGFGQGKLWFETMVFAADTFRELDGMMQRYATYEQAEAGHKFLLAVAKGEVSKLREEVSAELLRIATGKGNPE